MANYSDLVDVRLISHASVNRDRRSANDDAAGLSKALWKQAAFSKRRDTWGLHSLRERTTSYASRVLITTNTQVPRKYKDFRFVLDFSPEDMRLDLDS